MHSGSMSGNQFKTTLLNEEKLRFMGPIANGNQQVRERSRHRYLLNESGPDPSAA